MKHFVCLADGDSWDGDHFKRGDILVIEDDDRAPGIAFASFVPPAGIRGIPHLDSGGEDERGLLVFRYSVGERRFVLRGRLGVPEATVTIDTPGPPPANALDGEPVLEFGSGVAITSGRGLIRWGKFRPTVYPPKPFDPLRDDSPIWYIE